MEDHFPEPDSNRDATASEAGDDLDCLAGAATQTYGSWRRWAALGSLLAALLICDLGTKHWAQVSLQNRPGKRVVVIDGWLSLSYVRNPAGAWGFMRGMKPGTRHYLLLAVSVVAVGVLVFLLLRSGSAQTLLRVALVCILAGALGNIVDRVRWRYVVDFIDWHKWFRWPTFNVADIAITVGVVMMAVEIFVDRKHPATSRNGDPGPGRMVDGGHSDGPMDPPTSGGTARSTDSSSGSRDGVES